jgi:hypothetical protein
MASPYTGPMARTAGQIAENEACFQVQMIARRRPSIWIRLFSEREAGLTWAQILAGIHGRDRDRARKAA